MYRRIPCNRREGSGDNRTTAINVFDGPGQRFVPGQSTAYKDNQGIYTAVPGAKLKKNLHGPSMILSSFRFVMNKRGSFELPKLPCWSPGSSRTMPGVPGPTMIDTELYGLHPGSGRI
ncbi:hypothetical protein DPMN_066785 [Dreissena polymorpha]|uniref:Uncharacterized protein n=1 Tax=Dreissena polymorpha TaxID=45954 RepID=A0A9D3YY28_DREPO|nr:hypothetical protein DPMN_066785 [Dreissena polymorpha]